MLTIRSLVVAGFLAACTSAFADFDGPTPLAWRWQQSSTVPPSGSPLVIGDTIYHGLGNRVYAIDRMTGNQLWRFPKNDAEGFFKGTPVAFGETLALSTDSKLIFGVDRATGAVKWNFQTPYAIVGQPVAVGKFLVFRMEGDNLMAVDTTTGTAAWDNAYKFLDNIGGPLHSDGVDSIIFFDGKSRLVSINVITKKANWRQPFAVTPPDGSISITGTSAYLYSGSYLVSLNLTIGKPRWQIPLPEQMALSPAVGSDDILCVGLQGKAYIYDQQNGKLVTRKPIDLKSSLIVKPTAVGRKFVVPTGNGAVNFIDPEQPELLWQYFIRPLPGQEKNESSTTGGSGFGGGPGGRNGGGGAGGFGGFGGGQGSKSNSANETIIAVQASNPAVFAGNTLLVPALDGSLLAFDKETGVDLPPPSIKQSWPRPGEEISGLSSQEFIFRLDDETSGVNPNSIKVEFDGVKYDHEFGRDGYLTVQIKSTGKNKPLADGRRQLRITASDWLGNTQVMVISLRIDNTLRVISRSADEQGNRGPGSRPGGPGGPGGGGDKGGL